MPSWPWSKKKTQGDGTKEGFQAKSAVDRLADEGFRIIISTEVLEGRVGHQSDTIEKGFKKPEGEFVDDIYRLYFATSAAWFRSMENEDLAERVEAFLERYNLERDLKSTEALRQLRQEGLYLINKSYVNMDVEPLRPFVIQTQGGYGGGKVGKRDDKIGYGAIQKELERQKREIQNLKRKSE